MTPLTIIPNYDRKRLKSVGMVAAGERVKVTILGAGDWVKPDLVSASQTLRLRLIFGGKTVAVFPYYTDTEGHEDALGNVIGPDTWIFSTDGVESDSSGEDAVCEINLNTIPAERMLRLGGQCLWVLDDPTNHILYGTGEVQIGAWPRRRGTDTPYDLDGYPDFVEYAKAAVQAAQTAIESAVDTATGIVATATSAASTATSAATTAGTYANTAGSRMAAAENARDAAALSATAAGNAQIAAETAQGKAEDAQAAAETAQEKAEAWATGGTGGTPGATKNAKYWAEQAAETLEDKADKVEDATEGNFAALAEDGNLVDSGKAASDFAASEHSHAMSEVEGLSDALDAKGSAETLTNVANKVTTLVGNAIGDDARSVREIAALAIAAWAAGADARYDTLKEIADWILNDTTGAAKMASDIATLAANKVDKVSGYGLSKNDFTDELRDKLAGIAANANNYTLPAATASTLGGVKQGTGCEIAADGTLNVTGGGSSVTIDPALSPTSENPVQNKAVAAALVGKRGVTDLGVRGVPEGEGSWFTVNGEVATWVSFGYWGSPHFDISRNTFGGYNLDDYSVNVGSFVLDSAFSSRDIEGYVIVGYVDTLAKESEIPTVPTASTATPEMDSGNGAAGASAQFARGDHVHPSDTSKANVTDLPYALVTPGEWEFSGVPFGFTDLSVYYSSETGEWKIQYEDGGIPGESAPVIGDGSELSIVFTDYSETYHITATRAYLPGHLLDRANNLIDATTGDVTLTLPALTEQGKLRDFLVRLEISGSTVPTITFAAPTGETITYETDGDEFPVPDEAGTWLYSFTETAAHTFAVSLKSVSVVTQGGS